MPHILRQTLAHRILHLPVLQEILSDLTLAAGFPVRFIALATPFSEPDSEEEASGEEPNSLCAHLCMSPAGNRLCGCFRQKLRERASLSAAVARCDAGLWEGAVPVRVGAQTIGHLLFAGCVEDPHDSAAVGRARHLLQRAGVSISATLLTTLLGNSARVPAARRDALLRVLHWGADRIALLLTEHLATVPPASSPLVEQACRIVHAEYRDVLRLPALAARLGVSEGHFSRTFHQATGLTFVDYVARFRAERARRLLTEGDQPIAEVARSCGFSSVSQFNRVFRALYSNTPRKLRGKRPISAPYPAADPKDPNASWEDA